MPTEIKPGLVLGDSYRLTRLIGKGGMGSVWAAEHLRLPKQVAVKFLHAAINADREAYERFRREAEIASRLGHPNIVLVFDFNTLPDNIPYLVLELLDGESLRDRLDKGPLPLEQVTRIIRQIASALHVAHRQGVVHRDLKPENIFLCREELDGRLVERVKVLDFGISKIQGSQTIVTGDTAMLGTPQYMSPEQAAGLNSKIDGRTDQFALAAISYELLTTQPAFGGHNVAEVVYKVVHGGPRPLAQLAPGLPPRVYQALDRALAKAPEERFQTVSDFVAAFSGEQLITAAPPRPQTAPEMPDPMAATAYSGQSPVQDAALAATGYSGQSPVQDAAFAATGYSGQSPVKGPPGSASIAADPEADPLAATGYSGRRPPAADGPDLQLSGAATTPYQSPALQATEFPLPPPSAVGTAKPPPSASTPAPLLDPARQPAGAAPVAPAPVPKPRRTLVLVGVATVAALVAGGAVFALLQRSPAPAPTTRPHAKRAGTTVPPAPLPDAAHAAARTVDAAAPTTGDAARASAAPDVRSTPNGRRPHAPRPPRAGPLPELDSARKALARGDYAEARRLAIKAMRASGRSWQAFALLARVACRQKDLEGAINFSRPVRKRNPRAMRALRRYCARVGLRLP